jgi:hypothetical protein
LNGELWFFAVIVLKKLSASSKAMIKVAAVGIGATKLATN